MSNVTPELRSALRKLGLGDTEIDMVVDVGHNAALKSVDTLKIACAVLPPDLAIMAKQVAIVNLSAAFLDMLKSTGLKVPVA